MQYKNLINIKKNIGNFTTLIALDARIVGPLQHMRVFSNTAYNNKDFSDELVLYF